MKRVMAKEMNVKNILSTCKTAHGCTWPRRCFLACKASASLALPAGSTGLMSWTSCADRTRRGASHKRSLAVGTVARLSRGLAQRRCYAQWDRRAGRRWSSPFGKIRSIFDLEIRGHASRSCTQSSFFDFTRCPGVDVNDQIYAPSPRPAVVRRWVVRQAPPPRPAATS